MAASSFVYALDFVLAVAMIYFIFGLFRTPQGLQTTR